MGGKNDIDMYCSSVLHILFTYKHISWTLIRIEFIVFLFMCFGFEHKNVIENCISLV